MGTIYYETAPMPQTDGTNIVVNGDGKLDLGTNITAKLSKVDNKIDKPTSATEGQVLTYRNNEWVADDSQGGSGQFVIIAKGETYEGQTVTATKGTKSKSAVITSGVARIPVDEGGVWTLTLSSGETWNTPNMTYYGEYEVALVPKGSTVTPTDDIQMWLKCAYLNKSYTTISQVLADTNTLSALISDNNASDYLVRSTTWASDVCSNESAMTYIGLNDYCANKLLADSTWCTAICNNAYFEKVLNKSVPTLTSNTGSDGGEVIIENPNGETFISNAYKVFDGNTSPSSYIEVTNLGSGKSRIGYKFVRPVIFKKFWFRNRPDSALRAVKTFKIQGSNDNDTWDDLTDVITNPNNTSSAEYTNYTVSANSNNSYSYISLVALSGYQTGEDEAWISSTQFYCREQ